MPAGRSVRGPPTLFPENDLVFCFFLLTPGTRHIFRILEEKSAVPSMQEDAMDNPLPEEGIEFATFGRRTVAPRVCIADGKRHIRKFLGEALEELGFITCECTQVGELNAVLDGEAPDL